MTDAGRPPQPEAVPPVAPPTHPESVPPADPPPVAGPPHPWVGPPYGPLPPGGHPTGASGPAAPAAEPRRRLHPLSPALHGAKSLVVIIAALSWQTLSRVGPGRFAVIVAICVLGAGVLSLVSWYNTGYHVVGRELRIYEGLLWRRTRAIPLERLQAVEVVRPLLAQLTGLAELRLEVVGGASTEAPLAYLTVADAVALRERLLALAGRAAPAAEDGSLPARREPLHTISNRDLVVSQLLTPQLILVPFGAVWIVVQFLLEASWSFIAVASTMTAIAGVLLRPIRRVLVDWNFQIARDEAGLRVRRGLVETRSQVVPLHRVQGVVASWPLLWRPLRWLRLRLEVAGFGGPEMDGSNPAEHLLPVGAPATAERLLAEVLPGVNLVSLPLTPPPPRARWRHPLAYRALGAGLADGVFAVRSGRLTRRVVLLPYARIQSVRVVRGPVQRRLGLASVHVDAAAGFTAVARDRDVAEAWALAAELTRRARAARAAHP